MTRTGRPRRRGEGCWRGIGQGQEPAAEGCQEVGRGQEGRVRYRPRRAWTTAVPMADPVTLASLFDGAEQAAMGGDFAAASRLLAEAARVQEALGPTTSISPHPHNLAVHTSAAVSRRGRSRLPPRPRHRRPGYGRRRSAGCDQPRPARLLSANGRPGMLRRSTSARTRNSDSAVSYCRSGGGCWSDGRTARSLAFGDARRCACRAVSLRGRSAHRAIEPLALTFAPCRARARRSSAPPARRFSRAVGSTAKPEPSPPSLWRPAAPLLARPLLRHAAAPSPDDASHVLPRRCRPRRLRARCRSLMIALGALAVLVICLLPALPVGAPSERRARARRGPSSPPPLGAPARRPRGRRPPARLRRRDSRVRRRTSASERAVHGAS